MRTSVDVKLKEYDLKLLEKEYDRISIFVEDTKKLDRICNSVNKLTNGTILKAISSKEFEKKSCGDVLTISFPSALRAKYLDIVKWSKSGKPIDARKAGVNLAKKSNKNDILMCVGIQKFSDELIKGYLLRRYEFSDYKASDDKDALDKIKNIFDKIGDFEKAGFNRKESVAPSLDPEELFGTLPRKRSDQYDMMDIINRMIDADTFEEYKSGYGQTIVTGYARIDGWAVGIVANQRKIVKTKKGEMQFGGVIYSDSADKATRFIANCNQKKIPLVFLQDVTGFMVGSKSEHGGIIKDGAKMVNAVSNSVVPKFTVVVGNSYGAGNYAMCGKAYDPRLIVAWPSAELAVMSGNSAAKVLMQIEKASLEKSGEKLSEADEKALFDKIKNRYDDQVSPYYAAARLWTDAIIDPRDTRKWISMGIEAANHAPIEKDFNLGVIQT